jgi:nucleoside-diphosphate-sugar epimerase
LTSTLSGARVLVIGASGCIGRRLVERLVLECGAQVRVLVRRAASADSIARLPIEVIVGDVLDPHAVTRSAEGCALVFNFLAAREALVGALRASVSAEDRSDELPIQALSPWVVKNRARKARVSIGKARRILGYTPVFTLSHGMALTQQWAQSAGLIRRGPLYQWPASRHRAIS